MGILLILKGSDISYNTVAYVDEVEEAELCQVFVQDVPCEKFIISESLENVHSKLYTLFMQDSSPQLYPLTGHAASINEASFSCMIVRVISLQEYPHFPDRSIFRTWVGPQLLRTAANVLYSVYEVVSNYLEITVWCLCLHPHYVATKPISAAINSNAIGL